jgi:hypothetical protein
LHELAGRRLDRDDLDVGIALLEVAADTHQRAARAEPGDEHVDLGTVAPDLGAGALVVRERVRGIAVLEQPAVLGTLGADLLGEADRAVAAFLTGAQRHLGAEDLEQLAPFDAHVLGHHDAQSVAAQLGDERQADAGVARRRFEDRVAAVQRAVGFGELDHLAGDAVLARTAGILALELGPEPHARLR